ncbi:hypothetical protein [Streptacidiphilus carbonis]|jgi:hypothetical protein|uniref:hypothetical protein n=1 Tax=Streptacidiphilus carbonis TaxID=105422 RepID=UPI0005AADD17|nr:hypothetical protein [Streptacidiphilus carbonis]
MSGLLRLIGLALYIGALILVIWFLLYLFDANTGNSVVNWFREAADWLATWSSHLFHGADIHNNKLRALLVFGLPALVYGAVGNALGRTGSRE